MATDTTIYEYKTIRVERARRGDKKLNKYAAEGWELVDRYKQLNAYDRVTLRRPKH